MTAFRSMTPLQPAPLLNLVVRRPSPLVFSWPVAVPYNAGRRICAESRLVVVFNEIVYAGAGHWPAVTGNPNWQEAPLRRSTNGICAISCDRRAEGCRLL
jgi:hypothetical protein